MKTILITGCAGFIGSNLIAKLIDNNKIIGIDNFISSNEGKLKDFISHENFKFMQSDIIDVLSIEEEIDIIYNLACPASPPRYQNMPIFTLKTNFIGTLNLLELAREKSSIFIQASTSEIYGDPDPKHVPMAESYRGNVSCQGPRACYDESKRVGETLSYIYHTSYGTNTNTIRPFNVFGPGMQETDYRVLPNFASRIKGGAPLNVYGSGNQTRTFCYITDAMVGFLLVVLKGVSGEAYNIGNPKPEISMIDLVKKIEVLSSKSVEYNIVEYPDSYPADEPNRRAPDIRKAKLQLDFNPQVDLDQGLKRFLDWANTVYRGEQ